MKKSSEEEEVNFDTQKNFYPKKKSSSLVRYCSDDLMIKTREIVIKYVN